MHSTRMLRYITIGLHMFPLKGAQSHGEHGSQLIHGSLASHESAPKMATQSFQPFLHSTSMGQRDRQTCRPCYVRHL